MKQLSDHRLTEIIGGGDPADQPLTMPPGWTPNAPYGFQIWFSTISGYLRSMGIVVAQ